jgi:hypothetical protein
MYVVAQIPAYEGIAHLRVRRSLIEGYAETLTETTPRKPRISFTRTPHT